MTRIASFLSSFLVFSALAVSWACGSTAPENVRSDHIEGDNIEGDQVTNLNTCSGYQCNGNDLQECQPDAKGWTTIQTCETRTSCINGLRLDDVQCGESNCVPGERTCEGERMMQCEEDSSSYRFLDSCASPDVCRAGLDEGTCFVEGLCENDSNCSSEVPICHEGRCVACIPGERRCDDDAMSTCADDGAGWSEPTACPLSAPICGDDECVTLTATSISAGQAHTCAILSDTSVACWGDGSLGQLGLGPDDLRSHSAPQRVTGLSGVVALAAGSNHTCALMSDQTARCWGSDEFGQIGDGENNENKPTPVTVSGLTNIEVIEAGNRHTCAIVTGGSVHCWGWDWDGALGDGEPSENKNVPVAVIDFGVVSHIALGQDFTCASLETSPNDGVSKVSRQFCWGTNLYGTLGSGDTDERMAPGRTDTLQGAMDLDAGIWHACTVLWGGDVKCWGWDASGEVGNGNAEQLIQEESPVAVDISGVVQIEAGHHHTCALLSTGGVKCWGGASRGQLSTDSLADQVYSPVDALDAEGMPLTDVVEITAGHSHTCAILEGGRVICWGLNGDGQLGYDENQLSHQERPVTPLGF